MRKKKTKKKGWQLREKSAKMKESLEIKILKILTNKRFVRKKPDPKTLSFILEKIRKTIKNSEPIRLFIGFGYHKNPNATQNFLPDLAEELSFQQFIKTAESIKEVYPPGMEVKVITTGKLAEIVNGICPQHALLYHEALKKLVREKGWEKVIEVIPIAELYQERKAELKKAIAEIKKEVEKEWNDPANQEFWRLKIEHARRNIPREGLTKDEIIKKAKKAAFNYVVYRRAQKRIKLFEKRFPGAIQASYNLGHENTLLLWTLGKGNITQPWQGEAREIAGRIVVMTQQRIKKDETKSCQT